MTFIREKLLIYMDHKLMYSFEGRRNASNLLFLYFIFWILDFLFFLISFLSFIFNPFQTFITTYYDYSQL